MNPWTFGAQTAPNSQVVQSDEEYLAPFLAQERGAQAALYSAPFERDQQARNLAGQMATWYTGSNPNAFKYGGAMDGFHDNIISQGGGWQRGVFDQYAKATGYTGMTPEQIASFDSGGFERETELEAKRVNGLSNDARAERLDNSQRQHDAYGQMQGGSFFGGMMNEGYSAPNAGQVGARPGGLGGLGGMPTQAPQESGFGDYRATFNPGAQQHRAGAWGGGW